VVAAGFAFLEEALAHLRVFPFLTQVKIVPLVRCVKPAFEHRPPAEAAEEDCVPITDNSTENETAAMNIFLVDI
jgi:hypothetical protein